MLHLPAHSRYDYAAIENRRDYSWPGGKRLAFYVAINIEHFAFRAGRGADPTNRGGPQTTRNYAWRDYGVRVGVFRIFRVLDQLRLPATILLNSLVGAHYPDIIARIKARGDDVVGHGRTNAEELGAMWEHDEARVIAETTETIAQATGVRPTGWMGPGAANPPSRPISSRRPDIPTISTGRWTISRSSCGRARGRCSRCPIPWNSTTWERTSTATTPAASSRR